MTTSKKGSPSLFYEEISVFTLIKPLLFKLFGKVLGKDLSLRIPSINAKSNTNK